MLLELQKQMIANAYKQNKCLVLNIFDIACDMGDKDTVRYIAEHYADKFNDVDEGIAAEMQAVVAWFEAREATVQ